MRYLFITFFVMLFCFSAFANAQAESSEPSDSGLKKRVNKLEKELEILKEQLRQKTTDFNNTENVHNENKLSKYDIQRIVDQVRNGQTDKKPIWSSLDIGVYGYLKLDASYDTSQTNAGNFVKWVKPEANNDNDNEFNMTANQTRLGMKIAGSSDGPMQTTGRVEVDFYGSNSAENKAKLRMRHAYLKFAWPDENFSILAGQTWDVISPLNPYTLNFSVLWYTGNMGFRRPQIRLTKVFESEDGTKLDLRAAVTRTIGQDNAVTNTESGEDAGFPSVQARAGVTFPWLETGPTTIGVSGHWGQEEYDTDTSGHNRDFDTWSINLDMVQPVNDFITVKGELFTGANLNAFAGGIGQGVITDTAKPVHYKEINSKGGWLAANINPNNKWKFNFGAGMEDVDSSDINAGDRLQNRSIFGNAIYSVNENASIGLELSHWRTEYKGQGDADDFRAQTAFIYSF